MADGRSEFAWAHTSHLLALIANVNRDRKKTPRAFKPADWNPHATQRRGDAVDHPRVGMCDLKAGFLRRGMRVRQFDPRWIVRD